MISHLFIVVGSSEHVGIFHDLRECPGTSKGLRLVGGSKMDGNMLGEHCFGTIVDII